MVSSICLLPCLPVRLQPVAGGLVQGDAWVTGDQRSSPGELDHVLHPSQRQRRPEPAAEPEQGLWSSGDPQPKTDHVSDNSYILQNDQYGQVMFLQWTGIPI